MKQLSLLLFVVLSYQAGLAQWSTSGTTVYYNGGFVGIGTSSPTTMLQTSGGHIAACNSDMSGFVQLWSNNAIIWKRNSPSGALRFGAASDLTADSWAEYMRITDSGYVGINTMNTQGYQLAVNGSAIFSSARVKPYNNWPDFVLAKDYRLPSLDSVSRFIQHNGHLPDIPSADSVQAAGIDLGVTDAALLKKIEELTLYLIDQNKTLAAQEKLVVEQQAQLEAQQKEIEALKTLVGPNKKHH